MNLQLDINVKPFPVPEYVVLDDDVTTQDVLTTLLPDAENTVHIPLNRLGEDGLNALCTAFK